jgi:hypothetical protein
MLTGCEKRYTENPIADTADTTDTYIETETETESETDPATITESVEGEKVTESRPQQLKEFESSLGYRVSYDESLFQYTRTGDYDEIALKGQTFSSKPPVFFAAMKISNTQLDSIIEEIFDETAGKTTIGIEDYEAICQPTEDDGTYHNQYLVKLDNGDALLFEVQWYTLEDTEDTYGQVLSEMLASIAIGDDEMAETEASSETIELTESEID